MPSFWTHRSSGPGPRMALLSRAFVLAVLPIALFTGCGGNDNANEVQIMPIVAMPSFPAVLDDPVVFFQLSPDDTDPGDDLVMVDVMLRMATPQEFDGFTLEILFNPGILQPQRIDASATPFGDCDAGGPCTVLNSNLTDASLTGDLTIGVGIIPTGGGVPVTPAPGDTRLLTVSFVAASTGTSTLQLVDAAGRGDCEILRSLAEVSPPIPCNDGGASISASR